MIEDLAKIIRCGIAVRVIVKAKGNVELRNI